MSLQHKKSLLKIRVRYIFTLFQLVVVHGMYSQQSEFKEHIQFLSSDSLEGRLVGSNGERIAAKYIEDVFNKLNLEKNQKDSYLQPFAYTYHSNPHDTNSIYATQITSQNVVGYLNNDAQETVVIGAHYDHIGRNEHNNSRQPNSKGLIHNGADDNASGVAMVLQLAKELSENGKKEAANFLFICFSGEEDGLRGSNFFVTHELQNYPKIKVMLNLDMVGRMDTLNNLNIGGYGSSPVFENILTLHKPNEINLVIDSSGIGPSDHASFYLKEIPVLFFNTGSHLDYHKPSDDHEKINYQSMELIYRILKNTALDLAVTKNITYLETKVPKQSSYRSTKRSLGIMPSYNFQGQGLLIDAVIDGKPASNAGILSGDVILAIEGCEVSDIYDYMDCLSHQSSKDSIHVLIDRKGFQLNKELHFNSN
jgi:Zn-dependent M28 family amino/carboxypeptidase